MEENNLENIEISIENENYKTQKSKTVEYTMNYDEALCVLRHFYNKTRGKKTIIYTVLLSLLSIFFLITYFTMENFKNNLFVAILCIAVLIVVWLTPYLSQKRTAKGYELVDKKFIMTFYETGLGVGSDYEEKFFEYERIECDYLKEKEILCISILPESCFGIPTKYIKNEIEKDFIIKTLKENLKEKFCEK